MMECERGADRVHPLTMAASLSHSNNTVDLLSATMVKRLRVYLSGGFHRWRTGGRSSRPAREWRALCSYPVCEPTRPLRGRSSRATKRTRRCALPLKHTQGHGTHDRESCLASARRLKGVGGQEATASAHLICRSCRCARLPRGRPEAAAGTTRSSTR